MSQFSQRNVRINIDVQSERSEALLLRLAQANIRFQKSMGEFAAAQRIALQESERFSSSLDNQGRSTQSYIRYLKLLTEAALAANQARSKAARDAARIERESAEIAALSARQRAGVIEAASRREIAAMRARNDAFMREIEARGAADAHAAMADQMLADQRAQVLEAAAERESQIRARARADLMTDIEARGAAAEHAAMVERMLAEQRELVLTAAAEREAQARARARQGLMADIEARGAAEEHQNLVERMLAEQRNQILQRAAEREREIRQQSRRDMMLDIEARGQLARAAEARAAANAGPGLLAGIAGGVGGGLSEAVRLGNRLLATYFLWSFAIRQAGGVLDTLFIRPMRSLATEVLESTDAFRKVEVSLSGIAGSMRAVRDLQRDIAKGARGLPLTSLEALEAARAISYIPATAASVQNPYGRPERLQQLFGILQGLSVINPRQGIEGAEFSLREALAGQFRSLRFRFDISPQVVAQSIGKSLQDLQANPALVIEAMSKFVNTFVGPDAIAEMQRILSVQAHLFKGVMQEFFALVGDQGIYDRVTATIARIVRAARSALTPDAAGNVALAGPAGLLDVSLERLLDRVEQAVSTAVGGLIGHPVDIGAAIDKADIALLARTGAELIDALGKAAGMFILAAGDLVSFGARTGKWLGLFGEFDPSRIRQTIDAQQRNLSALQLDPTVQASRSIDALQAQRNDLLRQRDEAAAAIQAGGMPGGELGFRPYAGWTAFDPRYQQLAGLNASIAEITTSISALDAQIRANDRRAGFAELSPELGPGRGGTLAEKLARLDELAASIQDNQRRLAYVDPAARAPDDDARSARALLELLASRSGDPYAAVRVSGQSLRSSLTNLLLRTRETDIGSGGGEGQVPPSLFSGESALSERLQRMGQNMAGQFDPNQPGTFAYNIVQMQDAVDYFDQVNAGIDPNEIRSRLEALAGKLTGQERDDIVSTLQDLPQRGPRLRQQLKNEVGLIADAVDDAISAMIRSSVQGFSGLAGETIIRQGNSLLGSTLYNRRGGPLDVGALRAIPRQQAAAGVGSALAAALAGYPSNVSGAFSAFSAASSLPTSSAIRPEDVPALAQAVQLRTQAIGARTRLYDNTDRQGLRQGVADLREMENQLDDLARKAAPEDAEKYQAALDQVKQAQHDLAQSFDQDLQHMQAAADGFADGLEQSFRTALGDTLVHMVDSSANRIEDIFRNLGRSITQITADTIAQVAVYWARVGLTSLFTAGGVGGLGNAGGADPALAAGGGIFRGPLSRVPGMAEGGASLLTRTQGLLWGPGGMVRTVEDGSPELHAVIPTRGGGVPVRFQNNGPGWGGGSTLVQIINVVDSAETLRRGAARAPDAIINPVINDARGGGQTRKMLRLAARR